MEKTEINLIKERMQAKEEQLVQQGLSVPEKKELIVETVQERIEESLKEVPFTGNKSPLPSQIISQSQVPSNLVIEEANIKLSELVNIAIEEGIFKAVKTALKSGNAFLIDNLRDSLADRYYQVLKDKNLI
jgi:hypothetical protein